MMTLAIAATLLAGTAAQAQAPAPDSRIDRIEARFGRMDADNDGRITRAEYDAQTRARFGRMDSNGDGRIDAGESATLRGRGRMSGSGDDAGAAALTLDAFTQRANDRFTRLDTNGDGVIDAAERQARRPHRSRTTPTGN